MVHVGFASACIVDARACVCVSPRVHRVHSVMALCDYAIAYVSHRFALLVVLRASEMHGYACGRVRVPRRWFCLECMVGRRVAGGPSRTITHDFACVGGGGEEGSSAWWQVVQSSARASRSARVPLERRYGVSGAYAPMKRLSCVVSLTYACCRCDGFAVRVVTHAKSCVGGGWGEDRFVCQFACRVYAIVGVSAVCACAWSRGCWFASFTSSRSLGSLVSSHMRVCMFAAI